MRTFEFKGVEVTYDDSVTHSWKWQKAVASADPARLLKAVERLLCGRDEEYADQLCGNEDPDELDSSVDVMGELLQAIMEDVGGPAKN